MPALPEIEVIRRDLEKEIVGRRIKEAEVRPGSNAMKVLKRHGRRKEFQDLLVGTKVESVARVGRAVVFRLDSEHVMVVNLGESGSLRKTSASDEIEPHTHVVLGFTIGGQLRFVDPSKSGEIFVVPEKEFEAQDEFRDSLIDPLESPLTWHHFSSLLAERDTQLKELLLDDSFICGLGDIYSDEVLFGAGLRYDRSSNKLSSQDVRRLYRALMEILQDAVKARGTSHGLEGFTDLQGQPGLYDLELKVYEREGEPCRRCRNMIIKEPVDGGFTYFCPQCQS